MKKLFAWHFSLLSTTTPAREKMATTESKTETVVVERPLPHEGSITLMDSMGNDLRVVNAARVSLHKEVAEMGKRDPGLIQYLARNDHWTPMSHVMLTFRIKMPIFVARQWFKHCIGVTRNEVSRRYVDEDPAFWRPQDGWRKGSASIKQGSLPGTDVDGEEGEDGTITKAYDDFCEVSSSLYKMMLAKGVCREQARAALPQSMMTEFIETGSLVFYARVCELRCAPDAQEEVRRYANAIDRAIREEMPGLATSWAAMRAGHKDMQEGATE